MRAHRESNLELLRLIAIFAILASHYFYGTGIRAELSGPSLLVANVLSSGSRIAVNVFLLIGTWFMVDLPFNGYRPIRLYLTLAFFSIPITAALLFVDGNICVQHILQGLLPFTCMATWYTNAYISLLLLSPFLHGVLELPKGTLGKIAILIILLVSLPASLPWMNAYDYVSDMLWFPCVYLLTGYLKHHTHAFEFGKTWWYAIGATTGYLAIATFRSSSCLQIANTAELFRASIKSLPNISIAYCIFVVFLRLRIGYVKWINYLAKSVFSVYVIHQIPAIGDWQWSEVLRYLQPMSGQTASAIALNCLFFCGCLFCICVILDQIRLRVVDSWFMKSVIVKRCAAFLESILSFTQSGERK